MRLALALALGLVAACRPPGYGKEDPPDAAEPTADAPPGTADATIDTPIAATCDHAFRLDGYATASSAWLTGDFVQWAGMPANGAIELALGVDGAWTGSHAFPAGTHQYKFIINGSQWIADPTNPDGIDDGHGGKNSVYVCTP